MQDVEAVVLPKISTKTTGAEHFFGGVKLNQDADNTSKFIDGHGLNAYPTLFTPKPLEEGVSIGLSDVAIKGLDLNGDSRPYLLDVALVGEQEPYEILIVFQPGNDNVNEQVAGIITNTGFYIPFKQALENQGLLRKFTEGEVASRIDVHSGKWINAIPGSTLPALTDGSHQQEQKGAESLGQKAQVEGLSAKAQAQHENVISELATIEKIPELSSILEVYFEALEAVDFDEITEILSMVEGSQAIGDMAREQYITQVDDLLLGARDIQERGSAQVMTFGFSTSYDSLGDVQAVIEEMIRDITDLRDLVAKQVVGGDITSLHAEVLTKLDKYMFEGRVFKLKQEDLKGAVIFHGEGDGGNATQLFEEREGDYKAESGKGGAKQVELSRMQSNRRLREKIELAKKGDNETDNMFLAMEELPETVVIYTADTDFFDNVKGYGVAMQNVLLDYYRLPYEKRPNIVVYTHGFEPALEFKHDYQGFLFCSSQNELNNVLSLVNTSKKTLRDEIYNPESLVSGQREAYDNSDLREWENRTADTYQSLKHIFEIISERNVLSAFARMRYFSYDFGPQDIDEILKEQHTPKYKLLMDAVRQHRRFRGQNDPESPLTWHEAFDFASRSQGMNTHDFKVLTALDLGTGEGRNAGMIARIGVNVLGLDISPEQLKRLQKRVVEEGEGLRGEVDRPGLSYPALLKLSDEGLLPGVPIVDDQEAAKKLQTVEGNFFELQNTLNKELVAWEAKHQGVDLFEFFGETPDSPYVFSNERNMFSDVGFDMAMFNWHTFCEVGTPENQRMVLEQILNVMDRGGMLILEIPDRKIEPYASALRQYHQEHPDEPYGTIRDKKPDDFEGLEGEDMYPPRYFPDINELVLLLKSVGYEVSMDDVKTYLVQEEGADGKGKMTLKEHFIVAKKPTH
jgi:SAM-dependent methyltransferase